MASRISEDSFSYWDYFKVAPDLETPLVRARDLVAKALFYSASKLTNPICYFDKEKMRICLPLAHSKYWGVSKSENKAFEVFCRVVWALPVGVIGVAGALPALSGIIFRGVAKRISSKDFLHLRFPPKESQIPNIVRIDSWNIASIAGGESWEKAGTAPWNETVGSKKIRLDKNIEIIKENNSLIVCLEEVYDYDSALYLIEKLRELGYTDFCFNQGGWEFASSGHFVASKVPLEDISFTSFGSNSGGGSQFFVNKGFSRYRVPVLGENFWIVHTHLNPSEEDENQESDENPESDERAIRKAQVGEIQKTIKGEHSTVIVGDLNAEGDEYKKLFSEGSYTHYTTGKTSATDALIYFVKKGENPSTLKEFKLDHVLYTGDFSTFEPIEAIVSSAYDLDAPEKAKSDHHLISLQFERV